jgi:hypothetical protein
MVVDPNLLEKARCAAAQLAEAERNVLVSRGEYHAAVRRLHLGGASLREIAEALSLSHQRVQQIVHAAGGSWWRRMWRARNARAAICTWCERPPSEVAKLVAGPDVFICDGCITAAEEVLRGSARHRDLTRAGRQTARLCSFCGKRGTAQRPIVVGRATVCAACLAACREILEATGA